MFDWLGTLPPGVLLVVVAAVVAVESFGVPLPGETILIAAQLAVVVHPGAVSPWTVALAATVGAVGGDTFGYWMGRRYGKNLLFAGSRRFPRLLSRTKIDAALASLSRYGLWAVFLGRFVAVLRIFTSPLAGASGIPYHRFIVASALGSAGWAFGLTALVELAGPEVRALVHQTSWVALIAVVVVAAVVVALAGKGVKGRRVRSAAVAAARWARRVPFTVGFTVVFLAIGAATGAMWSPAVRAGWFADVAYGLPALTDGRWWTVVSGSLVAAAPVDYASFVLVGATALAWLEIRRGTRVAALVFAVGQTAAVVCAAAVAAIATAASLDWASEIGVLDAGPSGGYVAVLAFLARTLPTPWRLRAKLALGGLFTILLLFVGDLASLEHFIAAVPILLWPDRERRRASRRDWRLIAFTGTIAVAVAPVLGAVVPTAGPLGPTDPANAAWTAALTTAVVVAVIANGLRVGYRAAWRLALVLAVANVVWGAVLLVLEADHFAVSPAVQTSLASSVLWAVLIIVLVAGRRGFLVPLRRRSRTFADDASVDPTASLLEWGGGTLSWMLTWPALKPARIDDHYFGHEQHAGVVVVLGDPVGDPATVGDALVEFDRRATGLGLVPCLFSVSDAVRRAAPPSWRSVLIAEDAIIDLEGFTTIGKQWQPARTALHRAEREGIRFEMVTLSDAPWAVVTQVRAISEAWVGEKALPEMGFTLGGVREALDPEVRTALAIDADGSIHGVLSWLPVYGESGEVAGWTLDLMRRRDGGFPPVIEFLIVSSALRFQSESARFLSLSGAPLAGLVTDDMDDSDVVQKALISVGRLLEPLYGFQSLHAFKQKFHPRYEPMYLVYRDEADLPAIALALVRAYLPDASALDLARAGVQMARR